MCVHINVRAHQFACNPECIPPIYNQVVMALCAGSRGVSHTPW